MNYWWSVDGVETVRLSDLLTRLFGKFGGHRFLQMECIRKPSSNYWIVKGEAMPMVSEDVLREVLSEYGQPCIGN